VTPAIYQHVQPVTGPSQTDTETEVQNFFFPCPCEHRKCLLDKMIETSLEAEEDGVSGSAPRIECPYALTLVRVCLPPHRPHRSRPELFTSYRNSCLERRILRELHNNLDPPLLFSSLPFPSLLLQYSISSSSHFFSFRPIQATAIGPR
jgi:hypothetical protein